MLKFAGYEDFTCPALHPDLSYPALSRAG